MNEFSIRPIRSLRHLERAEELQREVWGFRPIDIVPKRLLRVMERNGSLLLGAFDAADDLVGFAFGYLGEDAGKSLLCSHMVGVLEAWRDRGVGFALKQAQRAWCEARHYRTMVWTFDPLESRNARFNLHKLACSSCTYWRNLYGAQGVGLHGGSATDRFVVRWLFSAPSPDRERARAPIVNPPRRFASGAPDCETPDLKIDSPLLRVLIPRDVQQLKSDDLALVKRWRTVTREMFEHYLKAGYRVVDYDLPRAAKYERYGSYILEREAGE